MSLDSQDLLPALTAACAIVGLTLVPGAMAARKGDTVHTSVGRVAGLALLGCFVGAGMDGYATNRADLMLLAALGIYALLTGIRALWLKRPGDAFAGWYRAGALDKGGAQFALVVSALIAGWSIWLHDRADPWAASPLVALGVAGIMAALADLRRYRDRAPSPHAWMFVHLSRMTAAAALAATLLALSAESVGSLAALGPNTRMIAWAAPLLAGGLVAAFWWRRYAARLRTGALGRLVRIRRVAPSED